MLEKRLLRELGKGMDLEEAGFFQNSKTCLTVQKKGPKWVGPQTVAHAVVLGWGEG